MYVNVVKVEVLGCGLFSGSLNGETIFPLKQNKP